MIFLRILQNRTNCCPKINNATTINRRGFMFIPSIGDLHGMGEVWSRGSSWRDDGGARRRWRATAAATPGGIRRRRKEEERRKEKGVLVVS
jgi:hypothetical protein